MGELSLTNEESENHKLEEVFENHDIWERDSGDLAFSRFVEAYRPGDEILVKLRELIGSFLKANPSWAPPLREIGSGQE